MIYLTLPELLHVAGRVLGPEVAVRDSGLLEAALARSRATAFGKDAYPSLADWDYGPGRDRLLLDAYGIRPDPDGPGFYRLLCDLSP